MFLVRFIQWIFKGLVDLIDFLLGLFLDDDHRSKHHNGSSAFKQHQSGSNLAALEALPPHYHQRQHQVLQQHHHHAHGIANGGVTMPLQSAPQQSPHHPPYPTHLGASFHQRPALHHRKKTDDYDVDDHASMMHSAMTGATGGGGVMTHDQSVFFSVDDQQYQVWKQLNQQVIPPPANSQSTTARSTPTILGNSSTATNEYDNSIASQSGGSIHIDMDRLTHGQQQSAATNLQQNTTNVHRRGSKSIFGHNPAHVMPGGINVLNSPSNVVNPIAASPAAVVAGNRHVSASPEIGPSKRKHANATNNHPSLLQQSSATHNMKNQQYQLPIGIETIPSMLQKQSSEENNHFTRRINPSHIMPGLVGGSSKQPLSTIPASSVTESNIATVNRGIRGSQPLVRLNRLTLLEAAKTPPPTNGLNKRTTSSEESDQEGSSEKNSNHSLDLTRMSLLLPIIPYYELEGINDKRNRIGGGAFGQVFRGFWKGTPVAIKILSSLDGSSVENDHEDLSTTVMSAFEEEVSILARLRHPNICLLLGVCAERFHKAIVTELVSRGSLWDALRQKQHFQVGMVFRIFFSLTINIIIAATAI